MSSPLPDPESSASMALDSATLNEAATIECSVPPVESLPPINPAGLLPKNLYACFFSLSLCIIVAAFDSVVDPTTIPTLTTALHAGAIVQLVSPMYLLGATTFHMLYGRFSDVIGRKTCLYVAIFIFTLGNLAAGFSTTLIQLLIFRAISGAGGAGIISLVQIEFSDMIVSMKERSKCQTIIGGIIAFGYAIGPLLSGAFLEKATWRWCFWISTPISLCALVGVIATLPSPGGVESLLTIDFVGAILLVCGCISTILPLIWGGVLFSWDSPPVLAPLFCGLLTLVIFCVWELKLAGTCLPIVPMYIFKHTTVAGVYITTFLYGFIYFSTLFYFPQYLQVILGYNPIRAGIVFIPFLITTVALSWIGSFVVNRTRQYKNIINCGYALLTMACGLVLAITKSHVAEIVAFMIVAGAGAGQALQTPVVAVQAIASKRDMSTVTAFRNFIRCLGGTFTLAVGSTIIGRCLRVTMHDLALPPSLINTISKYPSSLTSPSTLGLSSPTAMIILERGYEKGLKMVFVLNAALTVVATIISILMVKDKSMMPDENEDEEQFDRRSTDSDRTVNGSADFTIPPTAGDIEKAAAVVTVCEISDAVGPTSGEATDGIEC